MQYNSDFISSQIICICGRSQTIRREDFKRTFKLANFFSFLSIIGRDAEGDLADKEPPSTIPAKIKNAILPQLSTRCHLRTHILTDSALHYAANSFCFTLEIHCL
jgi:hypothetical protein